MRRSITDVAAAVGAGGRAVARHPGLLAATYLVQLAMSLLPAALLFAGLVSRYGREPTLDAAVAGDLPSLLEIARDARELLGATAAAVAIAALAYVVVSWLLTAGLIAVFADPPATRASAARRFGAGAGERVLSFARLFAWSLIPYAAVAWLAASGLRGLTGAAFHALGTRELLWRAALELAPAALLLWLSWTVIDYARIELVRAARPVAWRALLRAARRVASRPACLLHTLGGHASGAVLALAILAAAHWSAAAGVAVLALRQLALAGRHVVHVAVLAGQVEIDERVSRPRRRG